MPPFLIPFVYLWLFLRQMWDLYRDPRYRGLLGWIVIILTTGTIFYSRVENWSLTDAFYFPVITLSTVGYGDMTPTTTEAKLFTVLYLFFGLSIFLAFINMLAKDRELIARRRTGKDTEWDLD